MEQALGHGQVDVALFLIPRQILRRNALHNRFKWPRQQTFQTDRFLAIIEQYMRGCTWVD